MEYFFLVTSTTDSLLPYPKHLEPDISCMVTLPGIPLIYHATIIAMDAQLPFQLQ